MKKLNFSPIHVVTKKNDKGRLKPALFFIGSSLVFAIVGLYTLLYFTLGPRFWNPQSKRSQLPKPGIPNKELNRVSATTYGCPSNTSLVDTVEIVINNNAYTVIDGDNTSQSEDISGSGCVRIKVQNITDIVQGIYFPQLDNSSPHYAGPTGAPSISGVTYQSEGSEKLVNFILPARGGVTFYYNITQAIDPSFKLPTDSNGYTDEDREYKREKRLVFGSSIVRGDAGMMRGTIVIGSDSLTPFPTSTPFPLDSPVPAKPDLVVKSISVCKAGSGNNNISVTVGNIGNASTTIGFNTFLFINPTPQQPNNTSTINTSTMISPLIPGGSFTWNETLAPDSNVIYALVDRDNNIVESDEANNVRRLDINNINNLPLCSQ